MSKKILFIIPYPTGHAPSQRFRFEQYFALLKERGATFRVQSFLTAENWRLFYESKKNIAKARALLSGVIRRVGLLFSVSKYDLVFIHREAAPVGPPVFEWLIAKLFRKKIIYDFDDAIWQTDQRYEGKFFQLVKWRRKVKTICGIAEKVSCGNQFLCEYAKKFNHNVVLNPTTIDTEKLHTLEPKDVVPQNKTITIGWTGTHSTLKYLDALEPVIQILEREFSGLRFLVIANRKPTLNLASLVYKPWRIETEVDDLREIDIGVMPLPNDEWSKGKGGFKILQFMALEIPTVASPVGVNMSIVKHSENGFLSTTVEDWVANLRRLINDGNLRKRFGVAGRKFVEVNYSFESNKSNVCSLFEV